MAALMRLHSAKSIGENEEEKINEILNRPALPSSTVTTFGGLKREKLISHRLSTNDLGIVKRKSSLATAVEEDVVDAKQHKFDEYVSTTLTLSNSSCSSSKPEEVPNSASANSSLASLAGDYGSSDSDSSNK